MGTILINNISYSIKNKNVLKDISLTINQGECIAILGKNGAGKTTLLEVLTNIIKPTTGNVLYDGKKFEQVKSNIGVVWDNISLFQWLKAKEVIKYISLIYGIDNPYNSLYDMLEIAQFENRLMKHLSQGEKKRVAIYIATVHNPKYLILDESTSELDPLSKYSIWDNIFIKKGRSIIFTTHQWDEAEKYADKVVFIKDSKLVTTPKSKNALISETSLKNKVVVHKSVQLNNVSALSYELEQNIIYLISESDNETLDLIKKQTFNYSILPIELKDIYQYLILQS